MKTQIKQIAINRVQRVINGETKLSYAPSQNDELMNFAEENSEIKIIEIMKSYTKEITAELNRLFLES